MSTWLYQIDSKNWPPERYRIEIWEGERWSWPVGRKVTGGRTPEPGDMVAFFYSKTGAKEPGFFGRAVILEWWTQADPVEIYFRPAAPSDNLKMDPWGDRPALALADEIRGAVKQGTFWYVSEELSRRLSDGIAGWVSGTTTRASPKV